MQRISWQGYLRFAAEHMHEEPTDDRLNRAVTTAAGELTSMPPYVEESFRLLEGERQSVVCEAASSHGFLAVILMDRSGEDRLVLVTRAPDGSRTRRDLGPLGKDSNPCRLWFVEGSDEPVVFINGRILWGSWEVGFPNVEGDFQFEAWMDRDRVKRVTFLERGTRGEQYVPFGCAEVRLNNSWVRLDRCGAGSGFKMVKGVPTLVSTWGDGFDRLTWRGLQVRVHEMAHRIDPSSIEAHEGGIQFVARNPERSDVNAVFWIDNELLRVPVRTRWEGPVYWGGGRHFGFIVSSNGIFYDMVEFVRGKPEVLALGLNPDTIPKIDQDTRVIPLDDGMVAVVNDMGPWDSHLPVVLLIRTEEEPFRLNRRDYGSVKGVHGGLALERKDGSFLWVRPPAHGDYTRCDYPLYGGSFDRLVPVEINGWKGMMAWNIVGNAMHVLRFPLP